MSTNHRCCRPFCDLRRYCCKCGCVYTLKKTVKGDLISFHCCEENLFAIDPFRRNNYINNECKYQESPSPPDPDGYPICGECEIDPCDPNNRKIKVVPLRGVRE